MTLQQRINAFVKLGEFICQYLQIKQSNDALSENTDKILKKLDEAVISAKHHNGWFTENNLLFSFNSWCNQLNNKDINQWLLKYSLKDESLKTIAIIMAGNIPLVGFHDFISVLLSGHKVLVKLSSNDNKILPILTEKLTEIEPTFNERIILTEGKLEDFDAVIATGSNNTARYFEYYFRDKPSIIRKNRNSIAILSGKESNNQLEQLAEDIFRYYGLGCRNVSKVYVPRNYEFDGLFNALYKWKEIIHEHKYANNYDYNKAVYLMSEFNILDNGFIMLKEDESYSSPIATLFYEYYEDISSLISKLGQEQDKIQCIVSSGLVKDEIAFGKTQEPKLWDYADNVDTISFLSKIK